ncbi:hypothetical protein IFM89_020192 [Coptis chinensis]|uniref:Uncharacterized protein n=1 Tax=Coptis chinensis TaxID=261450 RepID=A0A835HG21_9MAGN|nr:hypothetical protein IFM89_020192 [Coptis chinensis]
MRRLSIPSAVITQNVIVVFFEALLHVHEAFMDYSNPAAATVRDLGVRQHYCLSQDEVCYIESGSDESGVKTLIVLIFVICHPLSEAVMGGVICSAWICCCMHTTVLDALCLNNKGRKPLRIAML